MKKNSIGQKYYETDPLYFAKFVENLCPGMDTITMTQLISRGAEIVISIYERPGTIIIKYPLIIIEVSHIIIKYLSL
jgi:hypothetical protein